MNPGRQIIHLDLDAFFCAVEEQRRPELQGKPFAVGGRPEQRGVVASCSYPARSFGVRSAMPMGRALRLCPDLQVVPGNYAAYTDASKKVMARLREVTAKVEQLSIDEAFLDVTENQEPAAAIARDLQQRIRSELELPCSLGVASNKLVAKIANDFGKSQATGDRPPNALTIVPEGTEAAFLAPLPVRALWGIGPKTEARLGELGVWTIGELAKSDRAVLGDIFGKHGRDMVRRAAGIDGSPVVTQRKAKSFSQEVTFSRDVRAEARLREAVQIQSQHLGRLLQRRDLAAATIRLKVRWPDFQTLTRQITLSNPTASGEVIDAQAWQLLQKVWQPGRAVRLIGVGVSGLSEPPKQLSFPEWN
jgi:DNA polymerase-4